MTKKIFIAIEIPEFAKNRLSKAINKWLDLPIKWILEKNFHLTLAFLGFVQEESLSEICEKIRKAAGKTEIIDLDFQKIGWFPSVENPKLVALLGEKNSRLLNLMETLEKELGIFTAPKKSYSPHITLGRARKYQLEALDEKPAILEKFSLAFSAESIQLMESISERGKTEFITLESFQLK